MPSKPSPPPFKSIPEALYHTAEAGDFDGFFRILGLSSIPDIAVRTMVEDEQGGKCTPFSMLLMGERLSLPRDNPLIAGRLKIITRLIDDENVTINDDDMSLCLKEHPEFSPVVALLNTNCKLSKRRRDAVLPSRQAKKRRVDEASAASSEDTALASAIISGDIDSVSHFFQGGRDVLNQEMVVDGKQVTAVQLALRYGHEKIFSILYEQGANLTAENKNELLYCAISANSFPLVCTILKLQSQDMQTINWLNVLCLCAEQGREQIFLFFVSLFPALNIDGFFKRKIQYSGVQVTIYNILLVQDISEHAEQINQARRSILSALVKAGRLPAQSGISPEARPARPALGCTPTAEGDNIRLFYNAIRSGDTDGVKRILETGIDINKIYAPFDALPICHAAMYGRKDIFFQLLAHGADICLVTKSVMLSAGAIGGSVVILHDLIVRLAGDLSCIHYSKIFRILAERGHLHAFKLMASLAMCTKLDVVLNAVVKLGETAPISALQTLYLLEPEEDEEHEEINGRRYHMMKFLCDHDLITVKQETLMALKAAGHAESAPIYKLMQSKLPPVLPAVVDYSHAASANPMMAELRDPHPRVMPQAFAPSHAASAKPEGDVLTNLYKLVMGGGQPAPAMPFGVHALSGAGSANPGAPSDMPPGMEGFQPWS